MTSTVHAARKVAVHHTAAAQAAAARVAQAARAIKAAEAVLAVEAARADNRLYAACFGAAAAAYDLPVSAPTTGPHADASTMTRAEQGALYASCWQATVDSPAWSFPTDGHLPSPGAPGEALRADLIPVLRVTGQCQATG